MPLGNHRSICAPDAKIIVSKDVGNREHRGLNPNQRHVMHYKIDGSALKAALQQQNIILRDGAPLRV